MDTLAILFGVFGGLALFLYGIQQMSSGMQKIAGDRAKKILETVTKNHIRGIFAGTALTAVIQSSSITTVLLVGLVDAGLMNLTQAVGVIMGANIGTTVTAQLVAFNVGLYALPIVALGFALSFFGRTTKQKYAGQMLIGLGILFIGMNFMRQGVRPLQGNEYFINMLVNFGTVPLLGILAGAAFTGIIQSSSATTALVIALGSEGIIGLGAAIAIILGANIGTCVTALLASFRTSLTAKRTSLAHILFNIFGVLIFFPFLPWFTNIVSFTSADLARQIANAHTLFNVVNTIIFIPLIGALIAVVTKLLPGKAHRIEGGTKYIDDHLLSMPSLALEQATREAIRMAKLTQVMLADSRKTFMRNNKAVVKTVIASVNKREEAVNDIDKKLDAYLLRLSERNLSEEESKVLAGLAHIVTNIERVGDHAQNITELAEYKLKNKLVFSSQAKKDLSKMFKRVEEMYNKAILAFRKKDSKLAEDVLEMDEEVDYMEKKFQEEHINRLRKGVCNPASGIVFVDLLRNLERIGDHADNIADTVFDTYH